MKWRKGLSESLEEYAARFPLPPDEVRATWRAQGLNRLARKPQELTYWIQNGCDSHPFRILPGVAIPTGHTVAQVEFCIRDGLAERARANK